MILILAPTKIVKYRPKLSGDPTIKLKAYKEK
jgi:hypothetical protein